jgi:hypothetical protein
VRDLYDIASDLSSKLENECPESAEAAQLDLALIEASLAEVDRIAQDDGCCRPIADRTGD